MKEFTIHEYPPKLMLIDNETGQALPKDISYSNKKGKLNLYASSETKEAQGSFFDFIVGGTSDTAETDTIGPKSGRSI